MLKPQIDVYMAVTPPLRRAPPSSSALPLHSTTSNRPGTASVPPPCGGSPTAWSCTAPTRTRTSVTTPSWTAATWSWPMGSSVLALEAIQERAAEILSAGKRPFLLGGEHLVTLGAFRAVFEKFPDVHIIHFDAHTDLRQEYLAWSCPTPASSAAAGISPETEDLPVRHPLGRPGGVALGPGPCVHPPLRPGHPGGDGGRTGRQASLLYS